MERNDVVEGRSGITVDYTRKDYRRGELVRRIVRGAAVVHDLREAGQADLVAGTLSNHATDICPVANHVETVDGNVNAATAVDL